MTCSSIYCDETNENLSLADLEMQWKDLTTVIEQSLKDGKARVDQLHTYEKLRDQVIEWLTKNEARVDSLEPVAVDADILKRQTDELRVIKKKSNFFLIFSFNLFSSLSRSWKNGVTMKPPLGALPTWESLTRTWPA